MKAKFKAFFTKYFLIILGGTLFTIYFWNRFLRSRTSKTIPLDLTVIKFFIILNICIMFLFIVISLLFPRKQNKFASQIINLLFIPIKELDKYLKNLPMIKPYYDKFLDYIMPKLDFFIVKTYTFYIIFWIFPRLILLTALIVDVFIFHRLHYKYMVILFGLLLLFNRCFKYSLKNTKEDLLKHYNKYINGVQTDYYPGVHPSEFEPDYNPDDEDGDTMFLAFDLFIEHYVNMKVYKNITVDIHIILSRLKLKEELWEKHIKQKMPPIYINKPVPKDYVNLFGNNSPDNYYKADNLVQQERIKFEKEAFEKVSKIALILEYYNYTSNEDKRIKYMKIFIYILYFICWFYVLYASIHTLDVFELIEVINDTWFKIENPFND